MKIRLIYEDCERETTSFDDMIAEFRSNRNLGGAVIENGDDKLVLMTFHGSLDKIKVVQWLWLRFDVLEKAGLYELADRAYGVLEGFYAAER